MMTTEWIIDGEGRFYRQNTQRDEIDVVDALVKTFSQGVALKLPNVLFIEGHGPVGLASTSDGGYFYFTVPLNEIVLKCQFDAFTTNKGPEMTPNFAGKGTQMTIPWNVAQAFPKEDNRPRIVFMACVACGDGQFYVFKQYLFAIHKCGNSYRMPLSNLFETCEVCNGEYHSKRHTAIHSVMAALEQFRNAPWNADLSNLSNREDVAKFFHFKPLENGFETLPVAGDWAKLCDKVATSELKYIV